MDATVRTASDATVRVWDPFVRLFHWGLAASFAVAWLSGGETHTLHYWAGYAAGALIALRLVMGVAGSRYARFSQFVKRPGHALGYARDMARGTEARHLGHNPVGGLMVVALMTMIAATAFTGWLQTTDAYWGVEWLEDTHAAFANLLLAMVLAHIAGVLLASYRHRENLVGAMLHGKKRAPEHGDVI